MKLERKHSLAQKIAAGDAPSTKKKSKVVRIGKPKPKKASAKK